MEQFIKVIEWQQIYIYDLGIYLGVNICVFFVSSKGIMEEDEVCGCQYMFKKIIIYIQGVFFS